MSPFRTVRDAKEYLIQRILMQADRADIPLSEIERKMLYFSESGWTLPGMMAISEEFDQTYDQDEYEGKISQVVRRIQDLPKDSDADKWDEAVRRLQGEDHYLLVLIRVAPAGGAKRPRGEMARMIVAGGVVLAVWFPFSFFVFTHVENRIICQLLVGGSLLALASLAAWLSSRERRKSA
jgi:hypothetical protein